MLAALCLSSCAGCDGEPAVLVELVSCRSCRQHRGPSKGELQGNSLGGEHGGEHGLCADVSVDNKGLPGRQEAAGCFLHFKHAE